MTRRYGDGLGKPVRAQARSPGFAKKLIRNPHIGLGEAYMDGDFTIENDDLYAFLSLVMGNFAAPGSDVWWQRPAERWRTAMRRIEQYNTLGRARANVAHHYDLSGKLYKLFLDDDMQYSCGYFRQPDDTLEQAQINKKDYIARKLLIEPGMSVLDIGCGWGGMGLTLARDFGAHVTGVTLSTEQHQVASERARSAGLQDLVDFRLMDYRQVNERFDRIVSIGMFEHVGTGHYREYFRHVHKLLKPDGVALIHTIGRATPPAKTSPFISRHIFPGAYAPSMSEAVVVIEQEELFTADVEVWRLHYAKTLSIWYDRFMANIDEVREIYDERFCRMWRFYLAVCDVSFRVSRLVVFQFQLSLKQDAVPLTREYLYPACLPESPQHAAQ